MSLKSHHFLEFGPFRVVPSEHLLLCQGTPVALTPRAFDLLMVLVRNSGHLVQKEELIRAVWQDSFVEEANLAVNISTLRKVLAEKSSGQQYIETFPRRGYRFNAKVEEVAESAIASPSARLSDAPNGLETAVATPAEPAQPLQIVRQAEALRREWRKQIAIPAIVLLSMSFVVLIYFGYRSLVRERRLPQTPRSLAILPFQNLKQDPNNDFLGFSLADAIITRLSYVSALAVRPSSDVEKYRGPSLDISKVAEELKVDTLLSGNFIREGDHVRITSQLIDVKTDQILWTDTLDFEYENLMTIQDNVAQQIIKGLKLHLSAAETERLETDKPIDPLAYEYYLRGIDLYAKNDFPMAIRMLEKSGEIEPSHALTWAHLGRSLTANASFEFGGQEEYHKAQVAYEKALSLQPLQMEARIYMANLFTDTGRVEKSVPLLKEVLKANPNRAEAHWELGYAYRFGGMLQESVSESELARRLDPEVKLNSSAQNSYLYLGQ